jgi:glutaredoxin-like protein
MTEPDDEPSLQVDFYWRPGCGFCSQLHRQLTHYEIELTMHNIWEDGEAAAFVRGVTGGSETVPTVTVAGRSMVNPSAWQVLDALEDAG